MVNLSPKGQRYVPTVRCLIYPISLTNLSLAMRLISQKQGEAILSVHILNASESGKAQDTRQVNGTTSLKRRNAPHRTTLGFSSCSTGSPPFKECLSTNSVLGGICTQQYLAMSKRLNKIEKYTITGSPKSPHDCSSTMVTMWTFYVSGKIGSSWPTQLHLPYT